MELTDLFTAALGLKEPWEVETIRFEPEAGAIDFDLTCTSKRLNCPACGTEHQPVHDRQSRSWQHLHFFQYQAFLHAGVPRVRCGDCGKVTQIELPWSRPGSGFTLLMEALVLTLAMKLPVSAIAMDLSKAYQAGATKEFPRAQPCFDAVHVSKLVHEALKTVRRAEVK